MHSKPTLIVLCGLPASGKSSYTKPLKSMFEIVNDDVHLERWAKEEGLTYQESYIENRGLMEMAVEDHLIRLSDEEFPLSNIIIDRPNLQVVWREWYLRMFPFHHKIAIAWDYPLDVNIRRLVRREELTGKHIPLSVIEEMKDMYVLPTAEEGFDEVHINNY